MEQNTAEQNTAEQNRRNAIVLLALDTATTAASLAVYDLNNGRLLAEMTWEARRRQTQDLLVTAREILAQQKLEPGEIDALAVTTGPGSFTGVRIGISTAKGIGLGLSQRPRAVGIPTLNVTAAPWLGPAQSAGAKVCAVIQAGRGRFNWVLLGAEDRLRRLDAGDHHVGTADDLVIFLADRSASMWLVGELTAELIEESAAITHVQVIDRVSGQRRAGHLAQLAGDLFAAGVDDSLGDLRPLYLHNL